MVAETLVDLSDRQLVEQFLARRDDAVFTALVRRHGPMVYRVCWRVLQQEEDAEDAFQATFLLLAQKLRTVRKHDSLASWLHGVAHRVALKAKAQATLRRRHEEQASVSHPVPPDAATWGELRTALDAALAQLPDKWRQPLILCYLEGRTQDEAAGHLGWSRTTLQRRLADGRAALGRRLRRRGVVWPAALSAVLLSDCVAPAALAPGLVRCTIEAAMLVAAGHAAISAASVKIAALTEGVLNTMWLSKVKIATAVLLAVGILAGVSAFSLVAVGPPGYARAEDSQNKATKDAPQPKPAVKDDAKWPADPPGFLEDDSYHLFPYHVGKILTVGCVARELKLDAKQIDELWKLHRDLDDAGDEARACECIKALHKKLPQILKPAQIKRFMQLGLQTTVTGGVPSVGAMSYPEIQQTLRLTEKQKKDIKSLNKSAREEWNDAVNARGGIDVPSGLALSTTIHKAALEKALRLLDKDQRRAWDLMVGEPFTFTLDRFHLDDKGEYRKVETGR
jgi:RNA polymerase sigma factor (sigma-70 family)